MNILDENIPKPQRELLEGRRVAVRQIGVNIGRKGLTDDEIISLLHRLRHPTFFTRDSDFYSRALCHNNYCLVYLSVGKPEIASFVRRFARHPDFRTQAKRMGKVIKVSHAGISFVRRQSKEDHVGWK